MSPSKQQALELLSDDMIKVLYSMKSILSVKDREVIGASVYSVSNELGITCHVLEQLIRLEFEGAASSRSALDTILRGNTVTPKVMDNVLKNSTDFLKAALLSPLMQVLSDDQLNLDIDPDKINVSDEDQKKQILEDRIQLLTKYAKLFLDSIMSDETIRNMPLEVKVVCRSIKHHAEAHSIDNITPLLGSYVILRALNPTIVVPQGKDVLPSHISPDTQQKRRNLVLISKIVQNVSNNVQFGSKETYMNPMNPIIDEYQQKCSDFLQAACADASVEQPASTNTSFTPSDNFIAAMNDLKRILRNYKEQISSMNELKLSDEVLATYNKVIAIQDSSSPFNNALIAIVLTVVLAIVWQWFK